MTLVEYMKNQGLKCDDFAQRISVTPTAVSRYLTGDRTPRKEVMRRIIEVTEGMVTANDFHNSDQVYPHTINTN